MELSQPHTMMAVPPASSVSCMRFHQHRGRRKKVESSPALMQWERLGFNTLVIHWGNSYASLLIAEHTTSLLSSSRALGSLFHLQQLSHLVSSYTGEWRGADLISGKCHSALRSDAEYSVEPHLNLGTINLRILYYLLLEWSNRLNNKPYGLLSTINSI